MEKPIDKGFETLCVREKPSIRQLKLMFFGTSIPEY